MASGMALTRTVLPHRERRWSSPRPGITCPRGSSCARLTGARKWCGTRIRTRRRLMIGAPGIADQYRSMIHQHGTPGISEHMMRGTPEQKFRHAGPPIGAHDDQFGANPISPFEDLGPDRIV